MVAIVSVGVSTVGLPPGSVVYIGKPQSSTSANLSVLKYTHDQLTEENNPSDILIDEDKVNWINIEGLHDVSSVKNIGEKFGVDPIILEDIVDTTQRPKMDDFGSYIHLIIKSPSMNSSNEIETHQFSFILSDNYLLSFHESNQDEFEAVRTRIRNNKGAVRKSGTDYLLLRLIDLLVDKYLALLDSMRDEIEQLDDKVIDNPSKDTLGSIQYFKREILEVKKHVFPLREILNNLAKEEGDLIQLSSIPFLRSIIDHVKEIMETIDGYREILGNQLDIYLSSVSNRTNEIMMFLTLITSVFIPLSFIVGLYGMNFENMPELTWKYGYPTVIVVMILVGSLMVYYFRKKKWLELQ